MIVDDDDILSFTVKHLLFRSHIIFHVKNEHEKVLNSQLQCC